MCLLHTPVIIQNEKKKEQENGFFQFFSFHKVARQNPCFQKFHNFPWNFFDIWIFKKENKSTKIILVRDVTAGATGATAVAPKFSDALTLF